MLVALLGLSVLACDAASTTGNTMQKPNSFYMSHRILHRMPAEDSSANAASQSYGALREGGALAGGDQVSGDNNQQHDSTANSYSSNADEVALRTVARHQDATQADSELDGDAASESLESDHDESAADQSHDLPDRNLLIDHQHTSQIQAMHDLFERRQLNQHRHPLHHQQQLPSSQELSPISIGLDPGVVSGANSPFNLPPFSVPNHDGPVQVSPHSKPALASADNPLDAGLGPSLPFGLNPLPHLLGFQNAPFDGPQRGDQSAHSNHHAPMPNVDPDGANGGSVSSNGLGSGPKVWPKIFRFTDGRINLSEFEKQKKIRLSSKNQHNTDNHIESAPIMFDGRQLKRKSFLILHGGIFS